MKLLNAKNIYFEAGGNKILKGINFSCDKGEIITITGPSGSGKSTFVKILASLLSPTSGEVLFEGENIADINPINYRREVSYAVQQPTLFGKTVKDNLAFPYEIRNQKFDKQHALDALKTVDLGEKDLDRSIEGLSGGERQRVALLRNIMFVPKVLILDEVTTGLDPVTKKSVHKMINYFNEKHKVTIIMITHDEQEIKDATRLIDIAGGKIVKENTK